jgi:PAS domain-containing protein
VLDHVKRGRFAVEPAGEDALELPLRVGDVDLDKGGGQLLGLPGSGLVAGLEPDDHIAVPHGLPRPQPQFARDAVALVEQAQHRHTLRHRRGARRQFRCRRPDRLRLGLLLGRRILLIGRIAAGGQRKQARGAG